MAWPGRNSMPKFEIIKQKIVVTDEEHILFNFNIVLFKERDVIYQNYQD